MHSRGWNRATHAWAATCVCGHHADEHDNATCPQRVVAAHTRHGADSAGSSCYNCHMPYTTYGLLKTIRSHTIGSPTVKESVESGRPNACNLCHLDKTLAWTGDALARWYGTPAVALNEDERSVAASLRSA